MSRPFNMEGLSEADLQTPIAELDFSDHPTVATRIIGQLKRHGIITLHDLNEYEIKGNNPKKIVVPTAYGPYALLDIGTKSINALEAALDKIRSQNASAQHQIDTSKDADPIKPGFCASDFSIASIDTSADGMEITIKLPDIFRNLLSEGYVCLDDKTREERGFNNANDEEIIKQHTSADDVQYTNSTISIYHDTNSTGLIALHTNGGVLKSFAEAVNHILPLAQQRVLDDLPRRFGIKVPKMPS